MPTYKSAKRGTWYCKFYYQDWTGKRRQKKKEGFKTQREAREYEREFIAKSKSDCSMSFKSLVELYLEDCDSRLKPTTLNNKKYIIELKILPYFRDMPVNTIDAALVRKWQNELISFRDANGQPYSQTYLKLIHSQLSAIFHFARKYYKLSENPLVVCGSIGKSQADSIQFWTLDEFRQFIPSIEDKPLTKMAFELLFWTGMRSGELLALTLNDFDLDSRKVSISKTFARLNKKDLIMTPKTAKSRRTVTLPLFLCDMVRSYAEGLNGYHPTDRLFPVTKSYLNYEMKRGSEKSGVKRIRLHDLRHSHASLLIEQGISPLLISERLGHEKVQTTLHIYSHLYPNKHEQVADKLQELHN